MKKYIIALLLFLSMFTSCQSKASISIQDLTKLLHDANTLIIDVRSKDEFDSGYYKNETNVATNIPHTEIAKLNEIVKLKDDEVPLDKTIVVYCRSGNRSKIAKDTLEKLGYKNIINAGAYSSIKDL